MLDSPVSRVLFRTAMYKHIGTYACFSFKLLQTKDLQIKMEPMQGTQSRFQGPPDLKFTGRLKPLLDSFVSKILQN